MIILLMNRYTKKSTTKYVNQINSIEIFRGLYIVFIIFLSLRTSVRGTETVENDNASSC